MSIWKDHPPFNAKKENVKEYIQMVWSNVYKYMGNTFFSKTIKIITALFLKKKY